MTSSDIIRDGRLLRRVKVGLRHYASLYQLDSRFYVIGNRVIDFDTCRDRAIRYLDAIEADV
jgi:hypothetical protein